MNRGQQTIALLLAVIAALLAFNMMGVTARPALARFDERGPQEPVVVDLVSGSITKAYQVWSDGSVDIFDLNVGGICDPAVKLCQIVPPTNHTAKCIGGEFIGTLPQTFLLLYEDGLVEIAENQGGFDCDGPWTVCTKIGDTELVRCPGDINENGETDFNDLLTVLSDWGACE